MEDCTLELTLAVDEERSGSTLNAVSYAEGARTYSAEDLTELAVRRALLGERLPSRWLGAFADLGDPFNGIAILQLTEDSIRPITELLVEALVGRGHASRVIRWRLGVPVAGCRCFLLEWQSPARLGGGFRSRTVKGVTRLLRVLPGMAPSDNASRRLPPPRTLTYSLAARGSLP